MPYDYSSEMISPPSRVQMAASTCSDMVSGRNRAEPSQNRPLAPLRMVAADVVLKGRSLVDGKRLVEDVPPIDPLTIGEATVFGDHQRVRGAITNIGQAEGTVVDHGSLGRVVGAHDPFAVDAAVVAGTTAFDWCCHPS